MTRDVFNVQVLSLTKPFRAAVDWAWSADIKNGTKAKPQSAEQVHSTDAIDTAADRLNG